MGLSKNIFPPILNSTQPPFLDKPNENILNNLNEKEYAQKALSVGQILTVDLIDNKSKESDKEYENISLPITSADDAASYK